MPVKIAIVDADKIECLKLQHLLHSRHYESIALHSLGELDQWLDGTPCRTVILDLDSLPVDRKYFRNFTRQYPHISMLCMSQRPFHPELEEAIRECIFACVNKPIDPEEIDFLLDSVQNNHASYCSVAEATLPFSISKEDQMNTKTFTLMGLLICMAVAIAACGGEQAVDMKTVLAKDKTYVGSDTCKMCHLEHYDSWKMTQHSRMVQDARANRDVIVTPIDEKTIRTDLAKLGKKLKVPADQIYVPDIDEILYTIGSQWKQRFIIKKDDTLFISPIQYNVETNRWVNYHEHDWKKRPWLLKCGGCHVTGTDLEKQTFTEPGVACESCHGKGSWHAALPKTAVFEKRQTIVNPAKLPLGVAEQICGSCHNRGKALNMKGAGWPVGYEPGKALAAFYQSTSYAGGNKKHLYSNEFSKGHHQQHIDWSQSPHAKEGVTCTSCHYVHQIGIPPTRSQTQAAGSAQCAKCHTMANKNGAHAIHSFANCVGCHMPRIAKSAEIGDIRSHTFIALLPKETIADPSIPNSCTTCHKHKDADLQKLQDAYDRLTQRPRPQGGVIGPVSYTEQAQ